MTISGCGSTGGISPSALDGDPGNRPGDNALPLRGDPTFDPDDLNPTQRTTYDTIQTLINDREGGSWDPYRMAERGELWWMGHGLQTHVQAVLTTFRITGDLTLLDHIDELAQLLRAELADPWRHTLDGTDGTTDGYLNWVQTYNVEGQERNAGKDTSIHYDQKAHATVAHIAYALHANRDLPSPKGYDYAAHADFWHDYLVNHFEAKMRARHKTTDGSFPIVQWPPTLSSYSDWTKWHYYMGQLTGDTSYTQEAQRMSDIILAELHTVDTPHGTAYVWRRSNPDMPGGTATYLSPTSYADYIFANAVEFHLEGFHFWADPTHMQRLALTITQLIIDEPDPIQDGLAADVGGEQERAGIPSKSGFRRINPFMYATMNLALLAPWDPTHTLHTLTAEMHEYNAARDVDTSRILTALMLDTHLHTDPDAETSASH